MIATSSVRLFVLWTTLPSIALILIALVFLKNQTRPLVRLAKKLLKNLVKEITLMILDLPVQPKLGKQHTNLTEWLKG